MLHVREIAPSHSTLKDFVQFPLKLYRDDSNYIIPSVQQQVRSLLGRHNAVITNGVQTFLMAYDGERPVGRLLAGIDFRAMQQVSGERQGYISMFECIDDQDAANALFQAAEAFLRLNGITRIVGPTPTLFDDFGVGLLVEGFEGEPTFLSPYNPQYYPKLFENAGFTKHRDHYSYSLPLDSIHNDRYDAIVRRAVKRFGFTVENIDIQRDLKQRSREFARIIAESTPPEWGVQTPTAETLYRELKRVQRVLWRDYVLVAYAGQRPVGLLFAIPDVHPLLKGLKGHMFPVGTFRMIFRRAYVKRLRTIMLYIVPEYQNKGVEAALILRGASAARQNGIQAAEASMVNEHNLKTRLGIEKLGGTISRVYRQYIKEI